MPKVAIIAYDGCYANSLANPQDMFYVANAHWRNQQGNNEGCFKWQTVSIDGDFVTTASGLRIVPDGKLANIQKSNIIALPSFHYQGERHFFRILNQMRPIIEWLYKQYEKKPIIFGHCTSSFLIAETELLNGTTATTSWWLADLFRSRYPKIKLKSGQLMVEHTSLISGGAANSEQLIILRLIERFMGQGIASLCAKTLLVDTNQLEQTPYITLQIQQKHNDPVVLNAQNWMQKNLRKNYSLTMLSTRLSVSSRTLNRRFKRAIGNTPNSYLQNLRIDTAKRLLESTGQSVERIMQNVGYSDISSFSKLFLRKTGLTPKAYRERFKI